MNKRSYGRSIAVLAVSAALCSALAPAAGAATASPAGRQHHNHHHYGALVDTHRARTHAALAPRVRANVPASVDLSNYLPSVGDQGQVGSCVAWAIDWSAITIMENEQGITGAPHAPMYTYAQIAQGNDQGSYASQHFAILTSQGLDTKADYWQGDFDYTTQPDSNETANAANWKLSGSTSLNTGAALVDDVKNSLSQGMPVVFAFDVYQSFEDLNSSTAADYSYYPTDSELAGQPLGGHEITIVGYNDQGVKVANSWGSSWGDNGYVTLPWKFVTGQIQEADAVGKMVTAGA